VTSDNCQSNCLSLAARQRSAVAGLCVAPAPHDSSVFVALTRQRSRNLPGNASRNELSLRGTSFAESFAASLKLEIVCFTLDRERFGLIPLVKQTTLAAPVEASGIGLHTAVPVHIRLVPAPPDTGYVFIRTDLGGFEIPASVEWVAHCSYATTLMRTGVMLSTVEHLLAALRGAGVDNVYIEVDNLEIPIMDGSAEVFTEMIERGGILEQPLARKALMVRERVAIEQGDRRIQIEPAPTFEIDCRIDFRHPLIGVQHYRVDLTNGTFGREIAAARTFGFTEEIEALRRANLIRGGSLDNAIVLTQNGMLNKTSLRFANEFVRHKILDIIGDLALLGMPILGRVTAHKSGHILHAALMTKLLRQRSAWEIVDMNQEQRLEVRG
jgi:UDP-3-O-[3-hydroxymyristoyl] N-acetylglucosamine deacetylase